MMSSFREWLSHTLGHSLDLDIDTYADHILGMVSVVDDGEDEEAVEDFLSAVLPADPKFTGIQLKQLVKSIVEKAHEINASGKGPIESGKPGKPAPPKKEAPPAKAEPTKKKGNQKPKVPLVFDHSPAPEPTLWNPGALEDANEPTNAIELLGATFPSLEPGFLEEQFHLANMDLTLTMARIIDRLQVEQEESQRIQETLFEQQHGAAMGPNPLRPQSQEGGPLSSSVNHAPAGGAKRAICRHFLAGSCFRADCWFSHDVQATVCSFWLRGNCVKGDQCEFLHGVDLQSLQPGQANSARAATQQPDSFSGSEKDFPQLPTSNPSVPRQTTPALPAGSLDAASTVKLSNLMEEFHWVSKSSVRDIFLASNSVEASRNRLAALFPKPIEVQQESQQVTFLAPAEAALSKGKPPQRSENFGERKPAFWAETGASLTVDYFKLRERAIEHAVARNKCFQRATEAFLRGDGAMAKKLSVEGRYHDEEMRRIHQEAADEMFRKRNQNTSAASRSIIDLHGLHVDEACKKLRQRITELRRQMYTGSLFVIIGTGHHSYDHHKKRLANEGKLSPSVLALLRELGFTPVDASTDQRGGMVSITFT